MSTTAFVIIVIIIAALLIGAFVKSDSIVVKGIIVLLLVVAFFTRPEKEKHVDAISSELMEVASEKYGALGSLAAGFASAGLLLALDVDDYFLFNVGKIEKDNGNIEIVSAGLFGHVFVFIDE